MRTGEDASPDGRPVVVAAGDIADCSREDDEATARLVGGIEGTILTLGDHAYPDGSAEDFEGCYKPSWGKSMARTMPSPGNHEYETPGASGYFEYFGKAAGDPDKGYYSYDLGAWHLVALNSNCGVEEIRYGPGSPQGRWLKEDIADNDEKVCTLAYFHHPLFASGSYRPGIERVERLWEILYAASVDVVLNGHDHNYQRFAPQDPEGRADPEDGIRQFVVGTGGRSHYQISHPIANTEVYNDDTYGVLELTLRPRRYDWEFVPLNGESFSDSGVAPCHRASRFTCLLRPLASACVARGVSPHYDACMGIKGLMLDLDGTLYVGEEPVVGAREAVGVLEASGLAVRYVTNTTRIPRRAVVERMRTLGFLVEEDEIFTPAWAAARLIGDKSCLALVDESLHEDLGRARLTEDSPEVVLVGDLGEGFTYARLGAAFRCLMEGAELVALQKNRYWHSGNGLSLDAGPFVAALEYASEKRAVVVGKPEESFFRIALEDMGLEASEVAMVGDDAEADIAGAKKAGLSSIQVRTGKWRPGGDVEEADLVLDSVAALPMALEGER